MSYVPPFVSQRTPSDGSLDDCTWAAGAMLIAKMTLGATVPSWAALRAASGDTGPSSLSDLRRGADKLLGIDVPVKSLGWSALLAELGKGSGAVVQGTYDRLPASVRSPGSSGPHAGYVQDYDGTSVLWFDPLKTGPVRLAVEYLKAFKTAGYGSVAIAREGSAVPKTADTTQPVASTPPTSNQQGSGGIFTQAMLDRILKQVDWTVREALRERLQPYVGRPISEVPTEISFPGTPLQALKLIPGVGNVLDVVIETGETLSDTDWEKVVMNLAIAAPILVTIGVLGYAGVKRLMPE